MSAPAGCAVCAHPGVVVVGCTVCSMASHRSVLPGSSLGHPDEPCSLCASPVVVVEHTDSRPIETVVDIGRDTSENTP